MTTGPPEPATLARWHVALVVAATLAAAAWGTGVERALTAPGFPLDDSWIHLQFARNLADGRGFSFNPGVPSAGSTAPLWTLLLSVPLAAGVGPVVSAKVLGVVLVCVTALAAAALAARLSGSARSGLLAGLAVALAPRVAWAGLSGMEVPLYAALATLALLAYARQMARPTPWGGAWAVWAGLAVWARPETAVAGAILAAAWVLANGRPRRRGHAAGRLWWPLIAFVTLIAAFLLFNLWLDGRPLPNTFYAKHYGMGTAVSLAEGRLGDALRDAARYPVNHLGDMIWWLASQGGLLFGAALAGVLFLVGATGSAPAGGRVLVAVLVLTPMAKGLIAPQPPMLVHDGRYVIHLLVLGLVVCACGITVLARLSRPVWLAGLLAASGLVQAGGATVSAMETYAAEVRNINDLQVRTGRWLAAHTTDDARIATNDIGAIAFFSRRFILDTEGLVSPDAVWDKRMWRLDRYLERSRPDLVVIFPDWYPYLGQRGDFLDEVSRISAPKVIAGGESLVIYRTPWTRPGRFKP